jgi:hypothetical protein
VGPEPARACLLGHRGVTRSSARAIAREDRGGSLGIHHRAEIGVVEKDDGRDLRVKGQRADEELAEAADVLDRIGAVHDRTVDTPTGRVVVLAKRSPTPRGIPRLGP